MWWGMHDGIGWWMVFGGVWMVLFWGVIIGLAVWGFRVLTGRPGKQTYKDDPDEIIRNRYARGEISREQFEEIRTTLR